VSVLVLRDERVLLLRRAVAPAYGEWDLPGGFLEADEHPMDGAVREAREETGLEIVPAGVFGIYMGTYRGDPDEPVSILNVVYRASAPHGAPRPSAEALAVGWFAPEALPDELAFAHNRAALGDWQHAVMPLR
jgi:ADP-ribose pyrophosphatase YjhB (NUDIX family)